MPTDVAQPFHARQFATLTTHVQREIERRILSGEIKAGERLAEAALARSLGVSRGPVREAIRGLAQAGLVDVAANRGAIVRRIGQEEALDLYDLRGAIFALACETVARSRSDAQCAALRGNLAQMEQAVADNDLERYYRLNVEFHSAILAYCSSARARSTYEGIVKEMHLFRRRGLSLVPNIEASVREHETIVAAVVAGDPEAAHRAGRSHIANGKARFMRTLLESGMERSAGGRFEGAAGQGVGSDPGSVRPGSRIGA